MTKQRRAQRPNNFSMWAAKGGGREKKKKIRVSVLVVKKTTARKSKQLHKATSLFNLFIYLFRRTRRTIKFTQGHDQTQHCKKYREQISSLFPLSPKD